MPNILILFKTITGIIIGVFSQHPLQQELNQEIKKSFLFNLNEPRFYSLNEQEKSRPFMYDNFFLVVGNSEIRVEHNKRLLYSNFGARMSFFETGGDKIEDFLGQKKNEIEFEVMEVHQIFFESK